MELKTGYLGTSCHLTAQLPTLVVMWTITKLGQIHRADHDSFMVK
jgi:hypothetical protein